ncbi:glycosyltransferase [Hymenobacter properus]|uniref:Glycosyltransferase family 2 protein n=1 Tax=Hymenobacter properus TaxID=2791026 RepID=A0A931BP09_9BACT|nr:glycosyltransferase family 2 protein [Hymenobacter properus]MBF9143808.1 glycosyltransferase family 2 protein [Hymenobacter properus]MBR7722621.1 glycosyltransferase family 2 protein [Microvirga sp. SRT04]
MNHATPARFLAANEATATAPAPQAADRLMPLLRRGRSARLLHQQLPPPHPALRMSVIIPAKDEVANLPATLAALAAQTDLHGRPWPAGSFEVIVLANNCTDHTADLVREQARRFPTLVLHVAELCLPTAKAHVGRARRLLMDEACARLELLGRRHGIIASTDADTRVAPTWLAAIEAEIAAGADAVGGRILTEMRGPALRPLRRIQTADAAYRLLCARLEGLLDPAPADPWPRHHQHFGASLALTAHAYRLVGGLPEVRYLEDEALCQALRRHDLKLRHSPAVQVLTSARRQGRVEVGLSWQLREWLHLSRQQREPQVENPVQLARRWQLRRQLHACWRNCPGAETAALVTRLGLPKMLVLKQLRQAATFGVLWEWALANSPALAVASVPLSQALLLLPRLIQSHLVAAGVGVAAG